MFEPLQLKDVNWKSLPVTLMYEILRLPVLIQDAENHISDIAEYVAGPSDFEEVFEA